jgi:hypothetical protein
MKVRRYSFGLIFKGFQRIVADEMGTTEELSEQLRTAAAEGGCERQRWARRAPFSGRSKTLPTL